VYNRNSNSSLVIFNVWLSSCTCIYIWAYLYDCILMPYGHEYSVVWPMSCCVFLVWLHCTQWFYWYFLISMGIYILRRYDEFVMCMYLTIIASLQYKGCVSVSREERKYIRLLLWFFISFAFIALYRRLLACAYLIVKDLKRRVSGKYTFSGLLEAANITCQRWLDCSERSTRSQSVSGS
jgi:hypothetical protein